MIQVTISRNEVNEITGFSVKGHAGYAESGRDIICAAVSAICYTAVGYFDAERYDGNEPDYKAKDGLMLFRTPEISSEEDRKKAQAVLSAMVIGLKQVQESYGVRYLRIKEN